MLKVTKKILLTGGLVFIFLFFLYLHKVESAINEGSGSCISCSGESGVSLPDNNLFQAWRGRVEWQVNGLPGSASNVHICLSNIWVMWFGSCYFLNEDDTSVSSVLKSFNRSADIGSDYSLDYNYLMLNFGGVNVTYFNQKFWVYGRRVSIDSFSPSSNSVPVGSSFNVNWTTDQAFGGVTLGRSGPLLEGSGSTGVGVNGPSSSFTCSSAGTATFTLDATGPGGSGATTVSRTTSVNCASGLTCGQISGGQATHCQSSCPVGYTQTNSWPGSSDCSSGGLQCLRCEISGSPTHLECISNTCTQVSGAGSNNCSPVGSSCGACTPTTCDAPSPACDTTTTGIDNCGGSCIKTGPACGSPCGNGRLDVGEQCDYGHSEVPSDCGTTFPNTFCASSCRCEPIPVVPVTARIKAAQGANDPGWENTLTIPYESTAGLSWEGVNAANCVSENWGSWGSTIGSGGGTTPIESQNMTGEYTFRIRCYNSTSSDTSQVTVKVLLPGIPPPTCPSGICGTCSGSVGTLTWTRPSGWEPPTGSNYITVQNISPPPVVTIITRDKYQDSTTLKFATSPGSTYTWSVRTQKFSDGALSDPVTGSFTCASTCADGTDIGLRLYQNNEVRRVAVEAYTPSLSPLRIYKDTVGARGVVLMDPNPSNPNASKMQIQTSTGVKALCLLPPPVVATGGTINNSGGYRTHTFISNGTFTVTSPGTVDVLVVAGGGSGASGGGGAGGMVERTSYAVATGSIAVTVGAGGTLGNNGGNSVFDTITATGGGRGQDTSGAGFNGGSGGGANAGQDNQGAGIAGQGNSGGSAVSANGGGGGGGANSAGINASGNSGGAGGNGRASSISGSSVTYAGGGGGAGLSAGGGGGAGGGGAGGVSSSGAGQANTGGGGGGGWTVTGAPGGSGIVIIRYIP